MKLTFFNKQAETTQPVVSNEIETAVEVLTPTTTSTPTTTPVTTSVESVDSKVEESKTFVIPKTFEDALKDLKSSKYVEDLPVTSDEEEIIDADYEEIDDDSTSDGDDETDTDVEELEEDDTDEDSCDDPAEAESPDEDTEEEEDASSEVTSTTANFAFTEAEASSIDISVDGAVSIDAAIDKKADSINKNIDESKKEILKYVTNGFEVLSEEITEIKKTIDKNVDIDAVTKFMSDINQLSTNYLNKIKDNS